MVVRVPILIVDDQTILREALQAVLGLEEDIEVTGTAENGLQAYEWVRKVLPRVVLMDVEMPVMNGMESLKKIKAEFPETRIIMFTTFANEEYVVEALIHGASGYLLKDMPTKKLISAIKDADQGEMMLPSSLAAKLAARLRALKLPAESIDFTEREKGIAECIIQGLTNREISERLHLTEGTVRNYITTIYSKIGTNDRGKAVVYLRNLLQ